MTFGHWVSSPKRLTRRSTCEGTIKDFCTDWAFVWTGYERVGAYSDIPGVENDKEQKVLLVGTVAKAISQLSEMRPVSLAPAISYQERSLASRCPVNFSNVVGKTALLCVPVSSKSTACFLAASTFRSQSATDQDGFFPLLISRSRYTWCSSWSQCM